MSDQEPIPTASNRAECCADPAPPALTPSAAAELARVFKALGDPVRLRLLSLIVSADGDPRLVGDLAAGFDLSGPTISHHLRVLREAGLIEGERRGSSMRYRARTDTLQLVSAALAEILAHHQEFRD